MREIDECTAEVFRRSEKRIKERRRTRNRMLALCIPAFLLVTSLSAMLLPAMLPAMRADDKAAELVAGSDGGDSTTGMQDASEPSGIGHESSMQEGILCPYTAVEIRDADAHLGTVTDRATVADLFDAVHSLFFDMDGESQTGSELFEPCEDIADQDQAGSTSNGKAYTIVFTAEEGTQTVYRLRGNALSNGETHQTVALSDEQTAELLRGFGVFE